MSAKAEALAEADVISAKLIHSLRLLGEICIVVRTKPEGGLNVAYPGIGAPQVAELLRAASDVVFNGPVV